MIWTTAKQQMSAFPRPTKNELDTLAPRRCEGSCSCMNSGTPTFNTNSESWQAASAECNSPPAVHRTGGQRSLNAQGAGGRDWASGLAAMDRVRLLQRQPARQSQVLREIRRTRVDAPNQPGPNQRCHRDCTSDSTQFSCMCGGRTGRLRPRPAARSRTFAPGSARRHRLFDALSSR